MNYLAEITAFERWSEGNSLPPLAQLLWYKLMSVNNRCGWQEWFQLDNGRLMGLIGVSSEKTALLARKNLIESGLIECQKGKKGSPNKYRMTSIHCKFYSKKEIDIPDPPEVAPETEMPEGIGSEELSDYLGVINEYFGMNEECKVSLADFTRGIFERFADRPPTQQDITNIFYRIFESAPGPDGRWQMFFPEEKKQLLEYVFEQAADAGKVNWKYIGGIYKNLALRGIKTVDDAEFYDAERVHSTERR